VTNFEGILYAVHRFSYHQRIADTVPESFAALLPEKPQAEYKYDKEGAGKNLLCCSVLASYTYVNRDIISTQ
jgi:hypothetical protein